MANTHRVSYVAHSWKSDERLPKVVPVLIYLLGKGASLDYVAESDSYSPLQCAAKENQIDLVRLLLELGADINGPPGENGFNLHYAVYSRNREMVDLYVDRGARVDDTCQDSSILVAAISAGFDDLVPFLVENGADINQTQHGRLPIEKAFEKGLGDLVKFLQKHGASFANTNGEIMVQALNKRSLAEVRELLELGVDPNRNSKYQNVLQVSSPKPPTLPLERGGGVGSVHNLSAWSTSLRAGAFSSTSPLSVISVADMHVPVGGCQDRDA